MASDNDDTEDAKQDAGSSITRVSKHKWGYSTSEVDEFLDHAHALYDSPEPKLRQEDVQSASFSVEKGGYSIAEVDAALTRLEGAVVDKRTQWDVQHYGRVAWRARTDTLARSLHDRAARPHGERFNDGLSNKPSYDRKQVDHVVDCVLYQIAHQLGSTEGIVDDDTPEPQRKRNDPEVWTLADISSVLFTQRKGHHGYDERQVDAYLNRVLQVLARIESFERMVGSLSDTTTSIPEEMWTADTDAFDPGFAASDGTDDSTGDVSFGSTGSGSGAFDSSSVPAYPDSAYPAAAGDASASTGSADDVPPTFAPANDTAQVGTATYPPHQQPSVSFAEAKHTSERSNDSLASLVSGTAQQRQHMIPGTRRSQVDTQAQPVSHTSFGEVSLPSSVPDAPTEAMAPVEPLFPDAPDGTQHHD